MKMVDNGLSNSHRFPDAGHRYSVQSVISLQDERHMMSGSTDRTHVAQTGHCASMQKAGSILVPFPSICFSSSPTHTLHDAPSLFIDVSDAKRDFHDSVHLQVDGWIVGPNGKLLLWVPPAYHSFYFYSPGTNLVLPRGGTELDLSSMAHGPTWHQCYISAMTT